MVRPATSQAITPGALSQLVPPSNCVTEEELSNTSGCGTLVPFGLDSAYQVQVSPDGKNAYSVAAVGDLIEYSRDPASGALSVIGCISSEPSSHPPCASKNATMNVTAVDEPAALAISPEGNSVYVVSQGGDANDLAAFSRNPKTGLLTKVGCIAHEASGTECETQGAKGLNTPYGVTVSPDGDNVYVASYSDSAVAEFSRDGESGAVEQLAAPNNCISSIAVSECGTTVAVGLERAIGIVVSPDDKDVYVAAGGEYGEGAIVALERDTETGALTQLPGEAGCMSTSNEACAHGTAINGPEDLVISPDGKNIYANSYNDSAVIELKRDPETGDLTQLGCLANSLAGETGPCTQVKSIANPLGVAISPGGQDLYVSSFGEAAVAAFERDPKSGALL
jgi:DNA-binding beta-propeller fold protein YncE